MSQAFLIRQNHRRPTLEEICESASFLGFPRKAMQPGRVVHGVAKLGLQPSWARLFCGRSGPGRQTFLSSACSRRCNACIFPCFSFIFLCLPFYCNKTHDIKLTILTICKRTVLGHEVHLCCCEIITNIHLQDF